MKTVHSFFPTTTKIKQTFKNDKTYKVMKKAHSEAIDESESINLGNNSNQIQNLSHKNSNIFRDRDNSLKYYSLDDNNERPIGGIELFKKMEKNNHILVEESTKRLSKKGSRKNIKQSREKIILNTRSHHQVALPSKYSNYKDFKEQTLMHHDDQKQKYTRHFDNRFGQSKSLSKYVSQPFPYNHGQKRCSTGSENYRSKPDISENDSENLIKINKKSGSVGSLRTRGEYQKNWASEQEKNYLDKMAILNEVNYNRPLIEKLGGKYFQCLLRGRYLDEPQFVHKSPYIYQIKDKLAETKFITKIKNMKPNLLERNKIFIKGKNKMEKEHEGKVENNNPKKRWQQWKGNDSFQA